MYSKSCYFLQVGRRVMRMFFTIFVYRSDSRPYYIFRGVVQRNITIFRPNKSFRKC